MINIHGPCDILEGLLDYFSWDWFDDEILIYVHW